MHAQHVEHRLRVVVEAGEGPELGSEAAAGGVGSGRHQRGDGGGPRPPGVGVVRDAEGHQEPAEVGVSETELAKRAGGRGDLRCRVVRPPDQDVLGGDEETDAVGEPVAVERSVAVGEPQEVQRREVARGVVQMEVLAARVAGVDPAGVGRGVPAVDRRVELQTGIGTLPCGLADLSPQRSSRNGAEHVARGNGPKIPLVVVLHRCHELVGHSNRVVGVLELDRRQVCAAETHVEPGVAQHPDLAFLARLGADELVDVGMVDVEDHHLCGATAGSSGLDRAG